jgi:hypothetical protein
LTWSKSHDADQNKKLSGGLAAMSDQCPLYPRKRTCAVQLGMSAMGQ